MKTDHLSEIRARLWDSLEMAHVRVQLIVLAAAYAVFMLIFLPRRITVTVDVHSPFLASEDRIPR